MGKVKNDGADAVVHSFRFSLTGLIVFSLCLMAGAGFVSGKIFSAKAKTSSVPVKEAYDPDVPDADTISRKGAWGELLTQNIKLERPDEYIVSEEHNSEPESWKFAGLNLDQVKSLLAQGGLCEKGIEAQTTPSHVTKTATNIVVTPDENFLLSMKPQTRANLYGTFYGMGVDTIIDNPLIFPKDSIESVYADDRLHPDEVALLKQLVYPADDAFRLADYVLLLRKIPTTERRAVVGKVLSRQSAVLVRVRVGPDSDIDKIAEYWGHMDNVRFTDIRPMLESLKDLPRGGAISLMYFLPPFARSRLYTFPLPPQAGDPGMDCHWTTFNFSRTEPDNRFNSSQFTIDYIKKTYYQINAPSEYGDIVLYVDEKRSIKHSAVFLADDLAFTKYGVDFRQPWMIVRLADMQTMYPETKAVYFRSRTD